MATANTNTIAQFLGPGGGDPIAAIRDAGQALTTPTAGDLLHVGELWISAIRTRTFAGMDFTGTPFAPYSTGKNGKPYYLYPNRDAASGRTREGRAARATAAKNRHNATGRIGVRTPTGIKYTSYAAAKAAHGVTGVNLYSMEQRPHMLDRMKVKVGAYESDVAGAEFNGNANTDVNAFQANQAADSMDVGFWGDEAARAKGHNEGTKNLPQRKFLGLNAADLAMGEHVIAQRMAIRARAGGMSGTAPVPSIAAMTSGPITLDDVGF